ncbi:UNVERIFIED_CONTAM: Endoglucanase 8 [Sesamum calycinum]|uniref:Endoglucanase n=1 Tax=Sesamum calycinum TaxID=2727403 RepID=A0AAW2RQ84_9LAMI
MFIIVSSLLIFIKLVEMMRGKILALVLLLVGYVIMSSDANPSLHDYGDALSKTILFFEGQRSGKLPSTQRLTWRKDSALRDGADEGMDLTGGYYDAGDNVKFNFPMAFSTTLLAWGVLEYGKSMGPDLPHALEPSGSTDYFLNPLPRPASFMLSEKAPGSEVAAEMAAALAAASLAFKAFGDRPYSKLLLQRASKYVLSQQNLEATTPFLSYADNFVCNVLPESPTNTVSFSPGGLLFKSGVCNMQHTAALSFLLLAYARYLKNSKHVIRCNNVIIAQNQLVRFTRKQVDYILGDNPLNISYMVGYGTKFPQRIHHRASSLPSIVQQPQHIDCKGGTPYFLTDQPNQNLLIGAVVGGPDIHDAFADDRIDAAKSEPTTYVNAPLVGLLAYFKARSSH